jgi:hypothetical protein
MNADLQGFHHVLKQYGSLRILAEVLSIVSLKGINKMGDVTLSGIKGIKKYQLLYRC